MYNQSDVHEILHKENELLRIHIAKLQNQLKKAEYLIKSQPMRMVPQDESSVTSDYEKEEEWH